MSSYKHRVSILIPCYNGSAYIDRAFKSILNQTEKNIEVIFVDDGSIDDSLIIAHTYNQQFYRSGHILRILHKINEGAASAIKEALEISTGKYIMPFDVDDELLPESCKMQADFLDDNTDCALVLTNGYRVVNDSEELQLIRDNASFNIKNNIFDGLISGEVNNVPGMYMISGVLLRSYYSQHHFLITRFGQNLQMLLPSAYCNLAGYIPEPLLKYHIHIGSHSNPGNYESVISNLKGYCDIRVRILKDMGIDNNQFEALIRLSYLTEALRTDARYDKRDKFNEHFIKIKKLRAPSFQEKMDYHIINGHTISYLYRLLRKYRQICDRIAIMLRFKNEG